MTLPVLDMPDDAASLANWLEIQIVGDTLGHLVAELSAAHLPDESRGKSLVSVLGSHLEVVLKSGLRSLPEPALRSLIRQPWLLLDLQERVLMDGGDYWRSLTQPVAIDHAVQRVWSRLNQSQSVTVAREQPVRRRQVLAWASTAAALVFGFVLRGIFTPNTSTNTVAWGWQKPGAVSPNGRDREKFLEDLAVSANEWFKQRPETPVALASRLLEFRQGCARLILSEKELPESDRAWLLERCRAWSGKLDGHLAALESGTPLRTVQAQADETINTLIKKLKEHAARPA